jgi:hypothetical protein
MSQAKFGTGQCVTFAKPTLITPDGDYIIVRVFPGDPVDQHYAMKCAREPYERVVRETDIRLRADRSHGANPKPAGAVKAAG